MSNNYNLQNNFKLVSYKRKNRKLKYNTLENRDITESFDRATAIRRIDLAKRDILNSDLYSSFLASLREGQSVLSQPDIQEIICLGLGKIGECMIARYQLGLLLCLKDLYKVKVGVFDPIFRQQEIDLLEWFGFEVLIKNTEGKYPIEKTTLFFLPHCPKQLSNNLIWSNWSLRLSNCIIVANSFTNILETNHKKAIEENAGYILRISPYLLELAIINTFPYYEIFNDLALHVFPYKKLRLLSDDFWNYNQEPDYHRNDLEFVRNKLDNLRIVSFSHAIDRDGALT